MEKMMGDNNQENSEKEPLRGTCPNRYESIL